MFSSKKYFDILDAKFLDKKPPIINTEMYEVLKQTICNTIEWKNNSAFFKYDKGYVAQTRRKINKPKCNERITVYQIIKRLYCAKRMRHN